jgi:uncharacterized protein (TIGR03437 family)
VYRSTTSPVINPGSVVNEASYGPAMAPGSLVLIFGTGLSPDTYPELFSTAQNAFPAAAGGVSVAVKGMLAG